MGPARLALRRRHQSHPTTARLATATAQPMPIPALAPVERPEVSELAAAELVGEDVGDDVMPDTGVDAPTGGVLCEAGVELANTCEADGVLVLPMSHQVTEAVSPFCALASLTSPVAGLM